MKRMKIMRDRNLKSCWNRLDAVGTCLNKPHLSHNVGTAVLRKKRPDGQFEAVSAFVGTVGTVCLKIDTRKKYDH